MPDLEWKASAVADLMAIVDYISDDNPDALVLLLMPEAEGKGGYFLFYRGKEVDRDFSSFLRESPSLAAKGGGRSDWLNGASPCMRPEEWREAIARFLST